MKELLKRFLPYLKDYIAKLLLSAIGMILVAGGTALSAYLVKPVLDKIFIEKNTSLLYILPCLIILSYLAKGFGKFMQTYYAVFIGEDIVRRLRSRLLRNILSLDIGFFNKFRTGEIISRLSNDISIVKGVVSNMIPEAIREILTTIALASVVIYQSPKLAFFAIGIMSLIIFPINKIGKKIRYYSRKSQEKSSDVVSTLTEIFNNIEIIKVGATENIKHKVFDSHIDRLFKINMKSIRSGEIISPLMEILGAIGIAVVIIIGGEEVIKGSVTTGTFFSFMAALFMMYSPIKRVSNIYRNLQNAIAASHRIFYLMDMKSSMIDGTKKISKKIKNIEFKNISFSYENKVAVLKDISFKAKKGQTIALIGYNGAGKSSLLNLLTRLYDPNKGEVLIDDINIKKYSLDSLRRAISVVTQRIYMFNDTVANNVAYGSCYDKDEIREALKKAGALKFVEKLKNGVDTKIEEFGSNLSGGQKQKIAIARAFYKNPQILIFDEATSALDAKSEEEIKLSTKKLSKDKISFIIAHRLNTIEHADNIVVLKDGNIVAMGNNEELSKNSPYYISLKISRLT